jgi:hypothetical protein
MDPAGQARVERRLAAILAGDVAGYSRLMGQDETGTLTRLRALRRELIDPEIAEHKELDALICRDFGIALGHAALNCHRASDRFDDTRELDQDAVAGGLDDAAFRPRDRPSPSRLARQFRCCLAKQKHSSLPARLSWRRRDFVND